MKEKEDRIIQDGGALAKGCLLSVVAFGLLPCPPAGLMIGVFALKYLEQGLNPPDKPTEYEHRDNDGWS